MFWNNVVFKLWGTIILLVAFVLMILTVLLLEFFENLYVEDAENSLLNQAENISLVLENHEDSINILETVDHLMYPSTRVTVFFNEHRYWQSNYETDVLPSIEPNWFITNYKINEVFDTHEPIKKITTLPDSDIEVIIVGYPIPNNNGVIFVYQTLTGVQEMTTQTTRIILLAATIAIILTTIFAFFLSTRITAPLIKMRKAAVELSRGEFHTKVPVLTYDEIGDLANAFNRMRRQLNYNITALNQEKSQLSSILKSMADGVITVSRSLNIILINPPAERFLAQIYNNISDNNEYTLPDELKTYFKQVINEEQEITKEINAQGRTFVLVMTPLYFDDAIRGVVALIRDMTEERQLDKLRKDFLANVSHELRTPLAMMQGYSEAIVDGIAETTEEKQELAQIIYEESLRMGRLVNELLDLARMEAGHITLNREKVLIKPFVERIARKFASLANEEKINFKSIINTEKECYIDPDRIEQVLTNLIDNAIRHTSENGTVSIKVEEKQNLLIVNVSDNGSGIPEEDLPFVFERFYKSDKSRTRDAKKKGTGLGLSIAKHIIEQHGGNIFVTSQVNEGTTFTFSLPIEEKEINKK